MSCCGHRPRWSNYYDAAHRRRVEVSSINFPRFDRNLSTGGNNYDESTPIVAHNAMLHSKTYPSSVTVTVVRKAATPSAAAR
jgi:predicted acyl esterase